MSKEVAEFGRSLVAFLLTQHFAEQRIQVERAPSERLGYHLLIPSPAADTPFDRPAGITVRARGKWFATIPPERELLPGLQTALAAEDLDLWIAFVRFEIEVQTLGAQVSLTRASSLVGEADFQGVTRKRGKISEIDTERLVEKAELRFFTKKL